MKRRSTLQGTSPFYVGKRKYLQLTCKIRHPTLNPIDTSSKIRYKKHR